MAQYLVTWEIDIDADNPEEAALIAKEIQIDPGSEAVFFTVKEQSTGEVFNIDLLKHDEEEE